MGLHGVDACLASRIFRWVRFPYPPPIVVSIMANLGWFYTSIEETVLLPSKEKIPCSTPEQHYCGLADK